MAGLAQTMAVLRLYSEAQPSWTVSALSDALGVPASTVYRTVRAMVGAGLLEAGSDATYRLGGAFVAFDRLTRLTDPLVRCGMGVLRDTVTQARVPCVGLLSRLAGDAVMCIADAATPGVAFQSSYERGRPMPLTRGATSLAILARMPKRRLAALLQANGVAASDDLGARLGEIRRRGYAVTRGEIDQGLVGVAAPVVSDRLGLVASLSLVVRAEDFGAAQERGLPLLLVSASAMVVEGLRGEAPAGRLEVVQDASLLHPTK